ncbi:MAG: nuclease-related domain-containing protein [Desulfobacteraceae bacterium]
MPSELSTILPVVVLVGVIHLAIFLIVSRNKKKRRYALAESVTLRAPGQSLLNQMDRVTGDIQGCYIYLSIIPLAVLVVHFFLSYILNKPESWLRITVSAGIVLTYGCYFLVRLMALGAKRKTFHHAYEGEVLVAKQLNRLMDDGYHVYHDFPADRFHIDHVVIGPTGVMAVETRTRVKAVSRNRNPDPVVTYDGRMLHFPKYSDYQIIEKAKYQAAWLSQWIAATVGEDIAARAIVALPGWSVKRTSAEGIPVVNPSQFETLFKHIKPRPLSEGQVASIIRQIDQQCRNSDIDGNACFTVSG